MARQRRKTIPREKSKTNRRKIVRDDLGSDTIKVDEQNRDPDGWQPTTMLDTNLTHQGRVTASRGVAGDVFDSSAAVGQWIRSVDAPGQNLTASFAELHISYQNRNLFRGDTFRTTLMYRPDAAGRKDAIPVPVRRIDWFRMVLASDQWRWQEEDADQGYLENLDASSNPGFPSWWDNITNPPFAQRR